MSSHEKLSAASQDRKARLAQLKSLKRKAPPTEELSEDTPSSTTSTTLTTTASPPPSNPNPNPTSAYLSGRNFDLQTRTPKLGFETGVVTDPTATLEYQAEQLALQTRAEQLKEEEAAKEGKGLDLFKLQPKRPNWDLKRDLESKMRILERRTEGAIARLVRERVEGMKGRRVEGANSGGVGVKAEGAQEVGMEGSELVEAMHLREQEEERERREDEEDEVEGDGS